MGKCQHNSPAGSWLQLVNNPIPSQGEGMTSWEILPNSVTPDFKILKLSWNMLISFSSRGGWLISDTP